MILHKELEIIPWGKTVTYYREKGYDAKTKVPIMIKIEDISDGSKVLEERLCDGCNKPFTRKHRAWVDTNKAFGKDYCPDCAQKATQEKIKKTNLEKYGVEFPMQSKEIKEKAKATTREHFGVDFSFQNKEINKKARKSFSDKYGVNNPIQVKEFKEKGVQTTIEKFGVENVFQNEEIKEKSRRTVKEKYGVDNISQSPEIKKKKEETSEKRYGHKYPLQSPAIQEKMRKTFYENNTAPTSSQQREIFNMCKEMYPNFRVELNYPLKDLSLDIFITTPENINIDIEYDGWYWHKDKIKDRRRDEVVKSYGYKVIRIRSGYKIPTKEQLQESINYVLQEGKNFSRITLDDWVEPE